MGLGAVVGAGEALWNAGKGIYNAVKGHGGQIAQGANILGSIQQQNAQGANTQDARDRYNQLQQLIQQQMGNNSALSTGMSGIQGVLNNANFQQYNPQQVNTGGFNPMQVSADFNPRMIDASQFGLPQAGQNTFNAGQDALSQMVNRDPAAQLGVAGGQLEQLAQNGGAQDVEGLLGALGQQQGAALNQQLSAQKAGVSGLGQLAGTAAQFAQGRIRNQSMLDNNALNAQVRSSAMENAQGRRLSAASQLGGLNLQANQNRAGIAGQLAQLGVAQGQLGLQGQQQRLGALQSNQGLQQAMAAMGLNAQQSNQNAGLQNNAQILQAMLANQNAGLNANQMNQSGQLQLMQQLLGGYSQLGQFAQNANQQNTNLLGLLNNVQQPQRATTTPIADAVTSAPVLASVMGRLGQSGAKGAVQSPLNPLSFLMPSLYGGV